MRIRMSRFPTGNIHHASEHMYPYGVHKYILRRDRKPTILADAHHKLAHSDPGNVDSSKSRYFDAPNLRFSYRDYTSNWYVNRCSVHTGWAY